MHSKGVTALCCAYFYHFLPNSTVYVIDLVSKTQVAAFWRGSMPFVTRACLVGATQVRICLGEGIERFHLKSFASFASCKLWLSGVTYKIQAVSICFLLLSSLASAVPSHCLRASSAHRQTNPHASRTSHADLDRISHMWHMWSLHLQWNDAITSAKSGNKILR